MSRFEGFWGGVGDVGFEKGDEMEDEKVLEGRVFFGSDLEFGECKMMFGKK